MRAVWTWCALWWWCGVCAALEGDAVRAALAVGGRYSLQSAVLLNSIERRDRELGYRLAAELTVAPAAVEPPDNMLCFTLWETRLEVRGKVEWAARGSVWDAQRGSSSTWCARLRAGALHALLLHPADPPPVRDYKRALASLYQFQGSVDGGAWREHNETDPIGSCAVAYESAGGSAVRKIKRACAGDAAAGASARRATRLALAPGGAVDTLHAEEVVTLHDALKVRSYHTLARLAGPPAAPPAAPPAVLEPHALPLEVAVGAHEEDATELESALTEHDAALAGEEPGGGGTVAAARALLALVPALRRVGRVALERALERDPRPGLCRALGLAGTLAATQAALAFTRLQAADPLEPLARAFLAGFTLAEGVHRDAVLEVVRVAGEARRAPLAHAALLAAAAAARGDAERGAVREAATRALARCRDIACRAARLLALANLRAPAADWAAEGAAREEGEARAAALAALRAAPSLSPAHLELVGRAALNASLPLEARAAALDLVTVRRAASAVRAAPLQLLELAAALHAERSRAAPELRRVLWQRLDALRARPPVQELFRLLPPHLRTWDARAHHGTSQVVVRETGWGGGAGGWRAHLDSVQVAAGGMLRRGVVALHLEPPPAASAGASHPRLPELEVEMWTRGMHALAGSAPPEGEEQEGEAVAGGLALSVAGYRIHDATLFDGQAELLSHVWAGTGSTPTAALRAVRVAHDSAAALPLLGGCAVAVRARAALALALDAHAAASLWQRTARGALALRGALVARADALVRVPWGELRAEREWSAEPRLRVALALDFYDDVAVCVRAAVPEHAAHEALQLRSTLGARRLVVRRGAAVRRMVPPRTLALGRPNDAACRTLLAADHDEDD